MTYRTLRGDMPKTSAILLGYTSFRCSSIMARCRASTFSDVLDFDSISSFGVSISSATIERIRSASSAVLGMVCVVWLFEHKSAPSVIRVQKLIYSYSPCNARHALLSEPFGFSGSGGSEVAGAILLPVSEVRISNLSAYPEGVFLPGGLGSQCARISTVQNARQGVSPPRAFQSGRLSSRWRGSVPSHFYTAGPTTRGYGRCACLQWR